MPRPIVILILLFVAAAAYGQQFVDVVYLADGRVIRGTIIEEQTYPDPALTIRTASGEELTFKRDEIERVVRERVDAATLGVSVGGDETYHMADRAWEVNLLGLIQFGPYARFHFKVADGLYVSPHVRLGYAGLLYLIFDWWSELGVGTSVLRFWPTGIGSNYLYSGGLVELLMLRTDGTFLNGFDVMGNFGHRWYGDGGGFMQVGLLAGAAFSIEDETITAIGMLELAWGGDIGASEQ